MDKIAGYLEVGVNDKGEVVINHPDLKPDADGVGHIVFSPQQARDLADLLYRHAGVGDPSLLVDALRKYADEKNWGRVCVDHHKSHYVRSDWLGSGVSNEWDGPTAAKDALDRYEGRK